MNLTYKEINYLIVDDYPTIRTLLKKDLLEIGIKGQIYEADSASMAMKLISEMHENSPIQFIISDWEMSDGHGIELLQYVRTMAVFKNIPFLMLTSFGKKELVLKAIQNGVSDFLLKPWEQDILESKLKFCLEKSIENKNKIT